MNRFLIPLSVFFGAISSLAYTPFNYIVLLYMGYLFLFYAFSRALLLRQYFYYGFSFGLAHFGVGTYWLFSIIDKSTQENTIILTLIIIGIILVLAFYFAFLGFFIGLLKKISHNFNLWLLLMFPLLSTLMEWLRSWLFTGFTWLSPADTLVNFGFAPLLPILGTLGISYLFYTLTALLLYVLLEKNLKSLFFFVASVLATVLLLWSLHDKNYTKSINKKIYTQIIQSHFTKKDKSRRYKVINRVKRFQELALQEPRAELSVWSESTMSVEYENVHRHLQKGFSQLRKNKVEVFYGGYVKSQNVLMKNSKSEVAYSKQHLMPFGEFTPTWLLKIKSFLPNFENSDLISTGKANNIDLNGVSFSPSICYELLFPEELRSLSSSANVLVHISDLGWFDHTWAQSYLLNLARMRSLEHGKPMIYVVNSGNSAFISAKGELEKVSTSTQGVQALYHHVVPYEGKTPYAQYGNKPMLYGLMLLLGIYLLIGRSRNVLNREK